MDPMYGQSIAGRLTKTYKHQLCTDTGHPLADQSGAIDDNDG